MKDPFHTVIVAPNSSQVALLRRTLNYARTMDPMHPLNDPRGHLLDWARNITTPMGLPNSRIRFYRTLVDNWDYIAPRTQDLIRFYCPRLDMGEP